MTKFPLGALLDDTYVLPCNAEKGVGYTCPGCNESVIIRKGTIKMHHFAHRPDSKCTFYNHPGEGEVHKMTKYIIADLLKKRKIEKMRRSKCSACSTCCNDRLIYQDGDEVLVEHRVNDSCIVDIAIVNNGKCKYIFEICDTHKTTRETPEPWFEIDAKKFLKDTHNGMDIQTMDRADILQELYDRGVSIKGTCNEVRLRLKNCRTLDENKIVRCMRKGVCRNCKERMSRFTAKDRDGCIMCEKIISAKNDIIQSTAYVECYPEIGKIYSIVDDKGTLIVRIDELKFISCRLITWRKFKTMLYDIWARKNEHLLSIIDYRSGDEIYVTDTRRI